MSTDFASDTLTDLERARTVAVTLEQDLSDLQDRAAQVARSIESDPCDCEENEPMCTRCERLAWLQPIPQIELDNLHGDLDYVAGR